MFEIFAKKKVMQYGGFVTFGNILITLNIEMSVIHLIFLKGLIVLFNSFLSFRIIHAVPVSDVRSDLRILNQE